MSDLSSGAAANGRSKARPKHTNPPVTPEGQPRPSSNVDILHSTSTASAAGVVDRYARQGGRSTAGAAPPTSGPTSGAGSHGLLAQALEALESATQRIEAGRQVIADLLDQSVDTDHLAEVMETPGVEQVDGEFTELRNGVRSDIDSMLDAATRYLARVRDAIVAAIETQ